MFTINDSWGDGITGGGYYRLDVEGQSFQGDEFGPSQSHEFGACDSDDCPTGEKMWQLDFTTDLYGNEFKWLLRKKINGKFKVVEKANFGTYDSNLSYSEKICISDSGCYKNVFVDQFGDGICCEQGTGSYRVTYGG